MQNRHHQYERPGMSTLAAGALALATGAIAYAAMSQFAGASRYGRSRAPVWPEDAPRRTLRRNQGQHWGNDIVVGRTVTINKPRSELYAFWRDFSNLPKFMENVTSVIASDGKRSHWTIAAPGGEVSFDSTITEERENELLAWRSDDDAEIRNSGRIVFRDAPGGRGTQVEATIAYEAPGGRVGQFIAKLFQREPHIQARRELRRFKQLMETGEISTTVPGPAAPRAR